MKISEYKEIVLDNIIKIEDIKIKGKVFFKIVGEFNFNGEELTKTLILTQAELDKMLELGFYKEKI